MDLGQILKDTTDQSNYARWQGYLDALYAIANEMAALNKDKNIEHIQIPGKIMQYVKDECIKYNKLVMNTAMGKKMKDLENIK